MGLDVFSLNTLTDAQLWDQFRAGKESAFIAIYQQHFHTLFQYGCQFTHNKSLVEDALQDMFIELRDQRRKITIKTSIRNYLFTCLRRKILLYKEKFNAGTDYLEDTRFRPFDIGLSAEQHLIDAQAKKENETKLRQVINNLTTRQREAIYYLYYQGMSYQEIKELMNLANIRSARNLIYKALSAMKSALVCLLIFRF